MGRQKGFKFHYNENNEPKGITVIANDMENYYAYTAADALLITFEIQSANEVIADTEYHKNGNPKTTVFICFWD